jgi:ribosome-binding protein aMBF1 (putative translation factor)
MNRSSEHWSERLRSAMKDRALSCAELARRARLPAEIVRKYVLGDVDNPRGDKLERLADTLKVQVAWLRYGA